EAPARQALGRHQPGRAGADDGDVCGYLGNAGHVAKLATLRLSVDLPNLRPKHTARQRETTGTRMASPHKNFPNLFVLDHPLIQHKLSIMRDKTTSTTSFR